MLLAVRFGQPFKTRPSCWLARLGPTVVLALLFGFAGARAQAPSVPVSDVDAALIEDIVTGSRVLADFGVLDGFGHVSARHPANPNHFLMSRSLAPALVTAADIMEFDLDSNPVDQRGRSMFLERFIHGEVYKARPDVNAVIQSHSPGVIPFGITNVPMRPVFHTAAFLHVGVPVFEIRDAGGTTDMLVRNAALAKALAVTLGDKPVALMRGHGNVVVGPNVKRATIRAVYTEVNARLQTIALGLGGPINYISPEEGALREKNPGEEARTWDGWKEKALRK
jgi:HCOMODA/2-hydroxy-3-carboxy-muconic semialdehyde decarboxylase